MEAYSQFVPVTGVPELDAYHQEIVTLINRFVRASTTGRGREEVTTALQFLATRLGEHFSAEEYLMRDRHYPDLETHCREHDRYRTTVVSLAEKSARLPGSVQLVMQTGALIAELLVDHIHRKDRLLASFLTGRVVPA